MHPGKRVLIVDDNETNVEIIEDLLEDECTIKTAFSGEECLEKAQSFQPDLILLDIMMPGIDGYETCRRLRKENISPYCKIIMVSAKAMVEERLEGYKAGADDYLTKPFNKDELRAKVRTYLKLITAEEADGFKSDLLGLLSHETNSPLHVILSMADFLLSDPSLSEDQKEMIQDIKNSGTDLHSFLSKVLLMSEFQAGQINMTQSSQSIKAIINSILEKLKDKLAEKNITISFNRNEIDLISLDQEYMEKALTMIVDNAIKFSPDNGEVVIETFKDNTNCFITISDHGRGIDEDDLHNIFNMFAVADVEHHHQGSGLSLTIAKKIIEGHGGSIDISNRNKGGAVVTIKLQLE